MQDTGVYQQYYEQDKIWQRHKPSDMEWSRIMETIGMIPEGVRSIVDVGCGDGLLTNQLVGKFEKVLGVDISSTALQHVEAEKLLAAMDYLPLADQSFDLAVCTEVMEHLPFPVFEKSLSELQRITRKHLLITVPNDEYLRDRFVKCPICYCTYHRYRHLHRFNLDKLKTLFPHFDYREHRYMGGLTVRPYHWDTILRQNLGDHWNTSEHCVCPQCGYSGASPLRRGFISYFLSFLRKVLPQRRKPHWLAVLYSRKTN